MTKTSFFTLGTHMKTIHPNVNFVFAAIAILLIIALAAQISVAQTAAKPGESKKAEQFVSIDFNNVDINVFIKFMSELSGTNFVVDQRVKGKVTIISPAKISISVCKGDSFSHPQEPDAL